MRAVLRYLAFSLVLFFSYTVQAATESYTVYTDYAGNIYLEAPRKFVLIHGEISVPLSLIPKNGLLKLVQGADGWQYEVLTYAQWQALELTKGHSGVASIESADFNNDGKADLKINFANLTLGSLLVSDITGTPAISEISSANNGHDPVDLPPVSSMPADIVGLSAGEFRVDESGGATYQIPLSLPAGIAGVQPQLAFSYNSNGGDGYMGTGWSFAGTSAIVRCPKNIAIDGVQGNVSFSASDRLCMDGQRLIANNTSDSTYWSAGTYHPEIDNFSVIRSHGSSTQGPLGFTVETKSGEVHYYGDISGVSGTDGMGKPLSATFKATDGSTQTGSDAFFNTLSGKSIARMWALKAIKDVKGNYIVFKYNEDLALGEHYLTEVHYTGRVGGNAPFATVKLEYSENPKQAQGWQAGAPVAMTRLLNKVHVKTDDEYYRHYQLNYRTSNFIEEKNYLESIQECVTADGKGCLPLTSFNWSHPDYVTETTTEQCEIEDPGVDPYSTSPQGINDCPTVTHTSSFKPFDSEEVVRNVSGERHYFHFIDINGDGLVDMVYPRDGKWWTRLGSMDSVWTEKCIYPEGFRECRKVRALSDFKTETPLDSFGAGNKAYAQTIDYDGDGKRDLLVAESESRTWHVIRFVPSTSTRPNCDRPHEVDCGSTTINYAHTLTSVGKLAYGFASGASVADIDGDGLEDILFVKDGKLQAYRNLGINADGEHLGMEHKTDLGSLATNFSSPFFTKDVYLGSESLQSASLLDVNGDGKTDVIIKVTEGYCSVTSARADSKATCEDAGGKWYNKLSYKLYTATGSSYVYAQDLGDISSVRAVDFNGDGYTDIAYRSNSYGSRNNWHYRLSNGKSFLNPVKIATTIADNLFDLTYFIDLNGDGRSDILLPSSSKLWQVLIAGPAVANTQVSFTSRGYRGFDEGAVVQFSDINSDGKLDLLTASGVNGWKVYPGSRQFQKDHVINGITNGWGVKTSINYQSIVDKEIYIRRDSSNNLNSDYFSPLGGMYVVSDVSTEVGTDNSTTEGKTLEVIVDYRYAGLLLHKKGRGMLGFEELQTIDRQTGVLTRTVYHQLWPFTGIPRHTTQWLGEIQLSSAENTLGYINIASNTTSTYSGGEITSKRIFPFVQSTEEQNFQLSDDLKTQYKIAKTKSSFVYDKFGNLTSNSVVQSDPATVQSDPATVQSDTATPAYTNTTSTTNVYTGRQSYYPRYGRLTRTTVKKTLVDVNGSQTNTRVSSFGYNDDLMLETETLAPGVPKYQVITKHTYDAAGNNTGKTVTAATKDDGTGVQSRSSSTVYDNRYRFVKQTTDTLGYVTTFTYDSETADAITGRIDYVTQTSANNTVSRVYFDIMGNQIRSYRKGAGSSDSAINSYSSQLYCSSSEAECDVDEAYVQITQKADGQGEKRQYIDKYGREIATQIKLVDGKWSTTAGTFDEQGRPKLSYEPYIGTTPGTYSEATYDKLGRIQSTTLANGGVNKISYQGLTTVSTDALDHKTSTLNNYLGQTKQVTDHEGNQLAYFYDATGNLKKVVATDKAGTASTRTTNAYDDYGRKTSMDDQDKGVWKYTYNAFGELLTQTNAASQVTSFTYDEVGRQLRRHDASGTTCWDYGTSEISYNRGKLVRVRSFNSTVNCDTTATADYEELYRYNSRGLVNSKLVRTAGSSFAISTSYDTYNRLETLTYPSWSLNPADDIIVQHGYSAENGMLTTLKDKKAGADEFYQEVIAVNARGQATEVKYGNGVKEARGFYADTGWVEGLNLQNSTGAMLHSFSYAYELNGNLDWREQKFGLNSSASFKEDFTYDTLDRLTDREITNLGGSTAYNNLPAALKMTQRFKYDNWGNITSKTNVGHYSYDATKTNRLTGVWSGAGSTGSRYYNFSYDSNGNITNDGKRSFIYTAFEKPRQVKQGSNYTNFAYGPDRQLYRRTDVRDGKTTDSLYIDGLYERVNLDNGKTEHKFYVGNTVITKRSDANHDILYLHKDNQGSTISITNKNGAVVQQFIYDPWGKQYSVSSNSMFATYSNPGDSKGYTGHKMVNDFEVIHMGGRTYNQVLGRFMQADPFIQAASNLQNYNRYSYVLNNPMSYTDPSGYFSLGRHLRNVTAFSVGGALAQPHPAKEELRSIMRAIGPNASAAAVTVGSYFCGAFYAACVGAGTYDIARAFGTSQTGALRAGIVSGASAYLFAGNPASMTTGQLAVQAVTSYVAAENAKLGQALSFIVANWGNGVRVVAQNAVKHYAQTKVSEELGRFASKNGLTLQELNILLTAGSYAGNYLVGSRYRGNRDGFELIDGLGRRGGTGYGSLGLAGFNPLSLPFDAMDYALGVQGLLSASAREYVRDGNKASPLIGYSLGAMDVNNLGALGYSNNAVAVSLPLMNVGGGQVRVINGFWDPVNLGIFGGIFSPHSSWENMGLIDHANFRYRAVRDLDWNP